jgi:hypothetical protein
MQNQTGPVQTNGNGPPFGADAAAGQGYMIVHAVTVQNAFPLEGAIVTVHYEEGPERFSRKIFKTNADGKTPVIILPAPDKSFSLNPECPHRPYSVYTVSIEFPEFYTNIYKDAQIWPGLGTFLTTNMMPRPVNMRDGFITKIYRIPPPKCYKESPGTGGEG